MSERRPSDEHLEELGQKPMEEIVSNAEQVHPDDLSTQDQIAEDIDVEWPKKERKQKIKLAEQMPIEDIIPASDKKADDETVDKNKKSA